MSKKTKKSKTKIIKVEVANESLNVGVTAKPCLVTLFEAREVAAKASVMGPLGGLDLTATASTG